LKRNCGENQAGLNIHANYGARRDTEQIRYPARRPVSPQTRNFSSRTAQPQLRGGSL